MDKTENGEISDGKKRVPCVEGLFVLRSEGSEAGHLLGSRCSGCDKIFFPRMKVCLNCGKVGEMEELALSRRGKLYCYTIVHQKVPGSMVDAPFAPVIVELPERVQVRSVLAGVQPEELSMDSIGRDVEIVFEKMKEDEEGNDVMTFKYRFI